jgi:signal peptidase II
MLVYIYRHRFESIYLRLSLAFILAGAVGNLIDRLLYGIIYGYAPLFNGRVVDFIQIEFWDFTLLGKTYTSWPVLNIADISVTAGFALMIFFYLFQNHKQDSIISHEKLIAK